MEDELDAMFMEELQKSTAEKKVAIEKFKQANAKSIEEEKAELMQNSAVLKKNKENSAKKEAEGLDMLLEEDGIDDQDVPQVIKDKVTEIEMDQKEKLRQTMLQQPSKKKTTALKNLQVMFEDYPVVTNES